MNFGQAVESLKDGNRITRKGWNGKDMWLVLIRGGAQHKSTAGVFDVQDCIGMKTVLNTMQPGWTSRRALSGSAGWA